MVVKQHQNTEADRSLGDRSGGLRPGCSPRIPITTLQLPTRGPIPTKTRGIPTRGLIPTKPCKFQLRPANSSHSNRKGKPLRNNRMVVKQHQNTEADRSLGGRSGGLRPGCSPRIPTKTLQLPTKTLQLPTRGPIPTKTLGIPTRGLIPTRGPEQRKIIEW